MCVCAHVRMHVRAHITLREIFWALFPLHKYVGFLSLYFKIEKKVLWERKPTTIFISIKRIYFIILPV